MSIGIDISNKSNSMSKNNNGDENKRFHSAEEINYLAIFS